VIKYNQIWTKPTGKKGSKGLMADIDDSLSQISSSTINVMV